jgi:hypothetical protein
MNFKEFEESGHDLSTHNPGICFKEVQKLTKNLGQYGQYPGGDTNPGIPLPGYMSRALALLHPCRYVAIRVYACGLDWRYLSLGNHACNT